MQAEDLRSHEMLGYDENTGFPLLGQYRIMAMGTTGLGRLLQDLNQSLGQEKMEILLTRFGYEGGLSHAAVISELYTFDNIEEQLKAGSVIRRLAGLAEEKLFAIDYDLKKKRLRFKGTWTNSFETLIWNSMNDKAAKPTCSILSGLVSGYATAVFGTNILVKEISCQSQGNEYCTFEGRTLKEWGILETDVNHFAKIEEIKKQLDHLHINLDKANKFIGTQNTRIKELKKRIHPENKHGVIFRSSSMAKTIMLAEKVANTNASVLIQGESGTGKEVLARFIHNNSDKKAEPFMDINCAALPPNLLEAELFGHTKGAFTGAEREKKGLFVEAKKGTIFLDEIGELPIDLQAKLLRALQEKKIRPVGGTKNIPVNARIIAATNQNLKEMIYNGKFREDLYYRIAVFPIFISPLRERRQDILLLARHFLTKLNSHHPGFSPEAIKKLETFAWPGNIRELENWVEYAVVLADKDQLINPDHFPVNDFYEEKDPVSTIGKDFPSCRELEKRYIKQILNHTNNNKTEASKILGISISTLWRRLQSNEL